LPVGIVPTKVKKRWRQIKKIKKRTSKAGTSNVIDQSLYSNFHLERFNLPSSSLQPFPPLLSPLPKINARSREPVFFIEFRVSEHYRRKSREKKKREREKRKRSLDQSVRFCRGGKKMKEI
jgi:hypothetical protein